MNKLITLSKWLYSNGLKKEAIAIRADHIFPDDVHDMADEHGILWDNDEEFMRISKELTDREHLDDMNQEELSIILYAIEGGLFDQVYR
jgi:hypothetical protein|tara:strand:- start:2714 stop:2980 length:267 start_codon:yes stop_codon:yes gene_type:complete